MVFFLLSNLRPDKSAYRIGLTGWFSLSVFIAGITIINLSLVNAHSINVESRGLLPPADKTPVGNSDTTQFLKSLAEKRSPQVICGDKLADLLRMVCRGRYNMPMHSGGRRSRRQVTAQSRQNIRLPRTRREALDNSLNVEANDYMKDQVYDDIPPVDDLYHEGDTSDDQPESEGIFVERRGRPEEENVGLHSTCCLRPCPLSEMSTFCHSDTGTQG